MTALDSASGAGVSAADSGAAPPRTTVPRRQQRRYPPQRRPLGVLRLADFVQVFGAIVAAAGSTGLLWFEISPFSGVIGAVVVWWILFVLYYAVLVSFDENRMTVRDRLSAVVVHSLAGLVFAALIFVILYTLIRGFPAFRHLNFFTQDGRYGGPLSPLTESGALHAVIGTLIELGIALGIALPFGLLAAVFMNEVPGRYSRFIRIIVDAMTAMPDILAGLFVYSVLVLTHASGSGFAAACALGITALPIICRASDVVLRLMPGGLTEAAYALGGTQWRTVRLVTLPTVRSGLATAVMAHGAAGDAADGQVRAGHRGDPGRGAGDRRDRPRAADLGRERVPDHQPVREAELAAADGLHVGAGAGIGRDRARLRRRLAAPRARPRAVHAGPVDRRPRSRAAQPRAAAQARGRLPAGRRPLYPP
jgi:phosphate transport system permease protein